ncbi:MAG: hypothetical protein KAI69_05740, partial [Deltaproteobacteria bacterium]|nr:hypothetical protein [Deltaproteobacteria bacterium]
MTVKVNRFCKNLMICGVMVLWATWSIAASFPGAVPWSELAGHLEQKGVSIIDLPVIDCPLGLADDTPSHLVIQVIENTLYEWKEYEFFTGDREVKLALEMIKPEARFLRAEEAEILLNASRLVGAGMESASDSAESGLSRGAVIGSDDRLKINDTTVLPWKNIVYIDMQDESGGWYFASGFLISPYAVVTYGYTLYDFAAKQWFSNFVVTAGQYFNDANQWVGAPFGSIHDSSDVLNGKFRDTGLPEYSYGALLMPERFPDIDTFMPLEFDFRPTGYVNYVGYPDFVGGYSGQGNMWRMSGTAIGYEGVDERILKTTIDMSNGGYGGPLYTYNSTTKSRRVIAIMVWNGDNPNYNSACRLVSADKYAFTQWLEYTPGSSPNPPNPDYSHSSYIPYFSRSAGRWTGLAMTNRNNAGNQVLFEYYSRSGTVLGSENREIPANGQASFAIKAPDGAEGWIKISSTQALKGLALVGQSAPESMFDMDLKTSLSTRLRLAHLAADTRWNSLVMICNPNNSAADITFKAYNKDGSLVATRPSPSIAANGSAQVNL